MLTFSDQKASWGELNSFGSRRSLNFWGDFYFYQREDCTYGEYAATWHIPTHQQRHSCSYLSFSLGIYPPH